MILDVSKIGHCCLPDRPDRADALFLDKVGDAEEAAAWPPSSRLCGEFRWWEPWSGSRGCRRVIDALPDGARLPPALLQALGDDLVEHWKPMRLLELAERRELPGGSGLRRLPVLSKLTVAVAYDEAFHCYFPDTLDLLES